VQGSQSTVDAAKQISLSTQQQKIAGEQVLIALREIDKGAEQGSLSIGHISSISRTLTGLAEQLQQLIDRFVLKR
jgi:methyl-accepting chemotaxis protein